MARQVALKICEKQFRRLWVNGCSRDELAQHFLCSVSSVDMMRAKLDLPKRKTSRFRPRQDTPDPTPEEISERALACRERHYAEKRRETYATTLQWRNGGAA